MLLCSVYKISGTLFNVAQFWGRDFIAYFLSLIFYRLFLSLVFIACFYRLFFITWFFFYFCNVFEPGASYK